MEGNGSPPRLDEVQNLMVSNAIKDGNLDGVIHVLVGHNIDVNATLDGGWSPFLLASSHAKYDILVHLLNLGADPLFSTKYFTALMAVCSSSSNDEESVVRCVKFLINQGVHINEKDLHGTTALMMAASNNHQEAVKELILRGAFLDVKDFEGWSAIFHAVTKNNIGITKLLIDSGASIKLEDRRGRKVADIAETKGLHEITALLSNENEEELVSDEPTVPINLSVQSFDDMISELPGNNGFLRDVLLVLGSLHLDKYSYSFYCKKISLRNFLLMDEADLKDAGVYLSAHRQIILTVIKKFQLSTWNKECFGSLNDGKLNSDDIALFLANITRHLYTLSSSIVYIKKNHGNKNKHSINEFSDIILKNIETLNLIESRLKILRLFGNRLGRLEKIVHVDLVTKKTVSAEEHVLNKFKFIVPSVTLLIIVSFMLKKRSLFSHCFSSVLSKMFSFVKTPKMC